MLKKNYGLYVIVVSDHNIAELLACVQFGPQEICLLASETMMRPSPTRSQAERLKAVLDQLLPNSRTFILHEGLSGSDLSRDLEWLKRHLEPSVRQKSGKGAICALNVTGGTKVLALALTRLNCWDEIHYKDFRDPDIQVWVPGREHEAHRINLSTPNSVQPSHLLATYADEIVVDKKAAEIPPARRYEMAHRINNSYTQHPDTGIPELHARLEALWYAEKAQDIESKAQDIESKAQDIESKAQALRQWLEDPGNLDELNEIADGCDLAPGTAELWLNRLIVGRPPKSDLPKDDHRVIEAENAFKEKDTVDRARVKRWCKWFAGLWLEDYLYSLASTLDECQAEAHVKSRLALGESTAGGERELDLVISRHAQLYVLEIKADIPKGQEKSALDQLDTLEKRVGKASKILYIGPALVQKLKNNDERRRNLEARAMARGIRIARSEAELKSILGIGKQ